MTGTILSRIMTQECLDAIPRLHTEEERQILLHIAQAWHSLVEEEQIQGEEQKKD
jgi:hypothetical protein